MKYLYLHACNNNNSSTTQHDIFPYCSFSSCWPILFILHEVSVWLAKHCGSTPWELNKWGLSVVFGGKFPVTLCWMGGGYPEQFSQLLQFLVICSGGEGCLWLSISCGEILPWHMTDVEGEVVHTNPESKDTWGALSSCLLVRRGARGIWLHLVVMLEQISIYIYIYQRVSRLSM